MIRKKAQNFGKVAKTVAKTKKMPKYLNKFSLYKHLKTANLGKDVKKFLRKKYPKMSAFLGYFIFNNIAIEFSKEAVFPKNFPRKKYPKMSVFLGLLHL
jgi:hypothetical protein